MSLRIFARDNFDYLHENEQFEELLNILKEEYGRSNSDFCYLFINLPYKIQLKSRYDTEQILRGQIDLVVLKRHMVMIIEFKDKKGHVIGKTNSDPWKIKYDGDADFAEEKSYFSQVSNQRTFLLQDYFSNFFSRRGIKEDSYINVDARLVFRSGSELEINFMPTRRVKLDTFEQQLLAKVAEEEKEILLKSYVKIDRHREDHRNGYFLRYELTTEQIDAVKAILDKIGYNRAKKWFKAITMSDLLKEITTTGYTFELSEDDIYQVSKDFGLKERNIDQWYRDLENVSERLYATLKDLKKRMSPRGKLENIIEKLNNLSAEVDFSKMLEMDAEHKQHIEQHQQDDFDILKLRKAYRKFQYKDEYDELLDSLYAEMILEQICNLSETLIQEFLKLKEEKTSERPDMYQADISLKLSERNRKIPEIFSRYESIVFDHKYKMKYPPSDDLWKRIKTSRLLEAIEYYKENG